eukprot:129881_1
MGTAHSIVMYKHLEQDRQQRVVYTSQPNKGLCAAFASVYSITCVLFVVNYLGASSIGACGGSVFHWIFANHWRYNSAVFRRRRRHNSARVAWFFMIQLAMGWIQNMRSTCDEVRCVFVVKSHRFVAAMIHPLSISSYKGTTRRGWWKYCGRLRMVWYA